MILRLAIEKAGDQASFEEIQKNLIEQIHADLASQSFEYLQRQMEAGRNNYDMARISALIEPCIRRGKGIFEGGPRYCYLQPILIGFGNVVDSLVAIRSLVFEQKKLTLKQFSDIVARDFAGEEALRQYILHKLPHYGNDDPVADEIAGWLGNAIREMFEDGKMMAAKIMMPGTFSYNTHALEGAKDMAGFDGRRAFFSYSDGCGPVQGSDTHGPTAMLMSMTSWDQSKFMAGMVINIKFSPKHLTQPYNDTFVAMLRGFIRRGGIEMQVNAVDRATLEDAKVHPERHRDLIVRIGGYSDYFTRLKPCLQDEVIERTEY